MSQYYFTAVFIIYSAPLIIESTPLREDVVIRRPESYAEISAVGSPEPPFEYGNPTNWPWGYLFLLVILQVLLSGILAGITIAVMSVDKTHLRVWMKTGGKKQRKFAKRILTLRSRPNWLFVTLNIASVMVAEALPLTLNSLSSRPWFSFLLSATLITLFGEILPQALVPPFILEVGGRVFWLLKCLMWILAVPACIPAYALGRFRRWHERKRLYMRDGILEVDEIMEFVRLHQHSSGHGGPLTDICGSIIHAVLSCQERMIFEDIRPWTYYTFLDVNQQLDATALVNMWSCNDPYILVVKNTPPESRARLSEEDKLKAGDEATEQDAKHEFMLCGILLSKDFVHLNVDQEIRVNELPLLRVPIVQANCSIHQLLSLLTTARHPCAAVVAPLSSPLSPEVVDITQHVHHLGTSVDQRLKILGFVDYQFLVARVLFSETTAHDTEDEKQSPNAHSGLLTPPSTPSSISNSHPRPVSSEKKAPEHGDAHDHGQFKAEGIGDVPQRSGSFNALMVNLTTISEDDIRSSRSTSELRRRRRSRPRPRGSVFEIFRLDSKDSRKRDSRV